MAFMQKQVTDRLAWYEIETNCGTYAIPTADADNGKIGELLRTTDLDDMSDIQQKEIADTLLQYTEGTKFEGVSVRIGYGARLSAPGYLDCTEWTVFDTQEEAQKYLDDTYEDDEETEG